MQQTLTLVIELLIGDKDSDPASFTGDHYVRYDRPVLPTETREVPLRQVRKHGRRRRPEGESNFAFMQPTDGPNQIDISCLELKRNANCFDFFTSCSALRGSVNIGRFDPCRHPRAFCLVNFAAPMYM